MTQLKALIKKYNSLNVVIKASIWFTICSFMQRGISVLTMPIFTRLMSIDEYGQYSIYITWYNIFVIIMTLNVHKEIFNKGLIDHNKNQDEFTANQMGLILSLGFIFSILYILFKDIINSFTGLSIFLTTFIFIEVISNAIISLWTSRKRFSYEYKKIVILTCITSLLNPLIGIFLVKIMRHKVEARVLSVVIVPLIIAIYFLIIYSKKGKIFSNFTWWKKSLIRSIPLLPHYLSLVLLNQCDKLMINHFIDSSATAIYSVAHTAGLLMVLVNESLNNAFVPWAYRRLKYNNSKDLKKMIRPLLYMVLLANLFLILVAPEGVYFLGSSQYRDAMWGIVPIAVSVYCTFIYTLFVDIEIYYEGNIFVTIGSVIATILNIILNYIFIPKFGYIAAAYTTLFSYFITMIFHYIFMIIVLKRNKKKQDMFDVKEILYIFLLLIVLSFLSMMVYNYYIIRYLFIIIGVILIFINKNKIIKIIAKMKEKNNTN